MYHHIVMYHCDLITFVGPSPPQNFAVVILNSTSVELSFEYPDSPNGDIQGYTILYAEVSVAEKIIVNVTLDTINDASDQTVVVTGLVPFTEYSFRVRAFSYSAQNKQPSIAYIGVVTNEIIVRTAEDGKICITSSIVC